MDKQIWKLTERELANISGEDALRLELEMASDELGRAIALHNFDDLHEGTTGEIRNLLAKGGEQKRQESLGGAHYKKPQGAFSVLWAKERPFIPN